MLSPILRTNHDFALPASKPEAARYSCAVVLLGELAGEGGWGQGGLVQGGLADDQARGDRSHRGLIFSLSAKDGSTKGTPSTSPEGSIPANGPTEAFIP